MTTLNKEINKNDNKVDNIETKLTLKDLYYLYGNKSIVDREIALELESKTIAYNKFIKNLNNAKTKGLIMGAEYSLIQETMVPLINSIKELIKEASNGKSGRHNTAVTVLSKLTPEESALITLKCIIGGVSKHGNTAGISLVTLCRSLGNRIYDEIRNKRVIEKCPWDARKAVDEAKSKNRQYFYDNVEKYLKGMNLIDECLPSISNSDAVRVGLKLVEIFIETTGLGRLLRVPYKQGYSYTFKLDNYVIEYLASTNEGLADLTFFKRPMLIKPLDWTTPYDGGYLLHLQRDETFIKCNKHTLRFYEDIAMPNVYKAVNALQSTPWRINKRILDILREIKNWETTPIELDFPSKVPSTDKPAYPKDNPSKQQILEWKQIATLWHKNELKRQGRRLLVENLYQQAEDYKNEDAIYFPYSVDFRGRAYAMTLLSPQGSDLNKSLIEFAEGIEVGEEGSKWLAFHGANLYGLDKKPIQERLSWVYSNSELIMSVAENPLDDLRWVSADSPWEFLAWCFEWNQYLKEGTTFRSHIPVAFDGSCSGLQHYSAMLRDPVGAKAVNLIPSDTVQDIYSIVADLVNVQLLKDYNEGADDSSETDKNGITFIRKGTKSLASEWLTYGRTKLNTNGITRKVTKRSVMTLCYGSKQYGFGEQLLEDIITPYLFENPLGFSRPKQSAKYLADIIWNSVQKVVVKAVEGMQWLQKVSSLLANQKDLMGNALSTYWITPVGFPVKQEYHKTKLKQVELSFGEKMLYHVYDIATEDDTKATPKENSRYVPAVSEDIPETIDPRKQRQGIAPNFVHSMDASHMMLTVDACLDKGITSFAMIHDSYGTHAGNAGILFKTVREVFVDTYTKHDVMADIRCHALNMLPDKIAHKVPECPQKGDLDLSQVKESLYAFS